LQLAAELDEVPQAATEAIEPPQYAAWGKALEQYPHADNDW
jgi:hypothetical protein